MLLSKKKKKIMIVDDDEAIRKMFAVYMNSWGFESMLAEDGIKAIDMVQKECPDLVILDLTMPKPDGMEICSVIKADKKTKKIPVIILSGSSKNSSIDTLYNMGVDAYMIKPVQWDRLKSKINDLI